MMDLERPVLITLVSLLAALVLGSGVRWVALRRADAETRAKRLASLRTWWLLVIVTCVAVAVGPIGVAVMMFVASLIGLNELISLGAARGTRLATRVAVYALTCVWFGYIAAMVPESSPVWLLYALVLLLTAVHVFFGTTSGFTTRLGVQSWGWIIVAGGTGHAVLLATLPREWNPSAGSMGWFLFLVILTETNDIAQALVGRRFGSHKRHRLAPILSPHKTWEGFIGGIIVTVAIANLLAPWMTPLTRLAPPWGDGGESTVWLAPSLAGIMISIAGLAGDLNMSAVKRNAGVKDSSQLLPGIGGMLDRIDSLTYTAPAFYAYVQFWCGSQPAV